MGDTAILPELTEDGGCGHPRVVGLQIADLFPEGVIEFPWFTQIGTTGGEETVKPGFLIAVVPFFNGAGGIMFDRAVGGGNPLNGDITKESIPGGIVLLEAGDERGDGGIAHQGHRLHFFLFHKRNLLSFFTSIGGCAVEVA